MIPTYYSPFSPPIPKPNDTRIHWDNLLGASRSLAIYELAKQASRPILLITPTVLIANELEEELNFFTDSTRDDGIEILSFPDWETLPYDYFSPHQDIISQRLSCLYRLPRLKTGIVIVSLPTLLQRTVPRSYVEQHSFIIQVNENLDPIHFKQQLTELGYRCVTQVITHGEYAIRGALIDVYPMGSTLPYRIDLLDISIDSIRTFDPETQRSIEAIQSVRLLPAHEYALDPETIKIFRQRWRTQFAGDPTRSPLYTDISQGIAVAGIEYYLHLFFPEMQSLCEYLPANAIVMHLGNFDTQAQTLQQEYKNRYEQYCHDTTRPILPPEQLILSPEILGAKLSNFCQIHLVEAASRGRSAVHFATAIPPTLEIEHKAKQPLSALTNWLQDHIDSRILFCAESAGRREILLELLKSIELYPKRYESWTEFLADQSRLGITVGTLNQGMVLENPAIHILTEAQFFAQTVMQRRRRGKNESETTLGTAVYNLAELKPGDLVVHTQHGIGRYLGLQHLTTGGIDGEYLALEYYNQNKLYVPVASLHLVNRYLGYQPEHVVLSHLGTQQWEKTKRKVAEKIRDVAAELLEIYAKRAMKTGHKFSTNDSQYQTFAAAFPFEETPDQQRAIEEVLANMQADKCMDHLVCGDVGFGKTEVAMRAAFVAVQANKQVAVLVPTTLLAQQHYDTFKNRFADWPVHIEVLSRFRTAKEQNAVIEQLKQGRVDIVVGTHKLLQKSIVFKDLGLVIIDEEHRFGVRQKEYLKNLRAEVDVLTLTATPIPRTLNMSFAGVRDLSIIATPPPGRLSIKTFVLQNNNSVIREAMLREISRGGQVYYLHNQVDTIQNTADQLTELMPEARCVVAHGQMSETELERVMSDFYHRRFNILVCTTIIESGIDIPTANTIIIERADKLGLSQLHQLRGRVGRSHHQAYAYLLTPPLKAMSSDAAKRLDAIGMQDTLGTGFTLATHDLEIRGAGELLGEEQSGQMESIGFELYMDMLKNAIKALKSGQSLDFEKPMTQIEVDLHISALIPEDYLPDISARLTLYKRISNAATIEQLDMLKIEMVDRFGLLPPSAKNLFAVAELKIIARPLGISKIDAGKAMGSIEFGPETPVDPTIIINLIQKQPHIYQLRAQQLIFNIPKEDPETRLHTIFELLKKFK